MEWPADFSYSPLGSPLVDDSLLGLLSSEWTDEENTLFENALADIDPTSPGYLEYIASKVPWKSMDDIRNHYQALLEDIELIESGQVALPNYVDEQPPKNDEGSPSNVPKTAHQRRRGVPWTEDEHQLFLMGLNKYGKGDWRSISRYYVITKTPTQVASHAQKYFRRQNSSTPADRRRPSIHDISTVSPTTVLPIPQRASSLPTEADPPFNFPSYGHLIAPPLNNGGMYLPTMNNGGFPYGDQDMMYNANQNFNGVNGDNGGYPAAGYMYPPSTMMNQQWGY